MATGSDVLAMLIPTGGWVITGDKYEGIQFLECAPITKEAFTAGFAAYDAFKAAQDARVLTPAEKLFNATGLTVAEYKALGL
jgi:hypothetical protein